MRHAILYLLLGGAPLHPTLESCTPAHLLYPKHLLSPFRRANNSGNQRPAPRVAQRQGDYVDVPMLAASAVGPLGDVIGEGSSCIVYRAVYCGQEAAVKMLLCGHEPHAEALREATMYKVGGGMGDTPTQGLLPHLDSNTR